MAVRNRSTSTVYVDELNSEGVATQAELDTSVLTHINKYHKNEPASITEDGVDYYMDIINNRWVSKQLFMMDFSDNDTTTRNIYLFQKKNIRCNYTYNTLPYLKNILIDRIEVSLDRSINITNIADIEDENGNTIYNIINSTQKYTLIENVNTVFSGEVNIYINGSTLRRPVIKLWMRLIK